jgi:hypothetical protein
MIMANDRFDWQNVLESEDTELLVDPNKMNGYEKTELIEKLYIDYMILKQEKKATPKIIKNYKVIIDELIKNFAH